MNKAATAAAKMVHIHQATESSPLMVGGKPSSAGQPYISDDRSSRAARERAEKRADEGSRRQFGWRWSPLSRLLVVVLLALVGGVALTKRFVGRMRTQQTLDTYTKLNVAFVGNSMFYFNGPYYYCALSVESRL